MKTYRKIAICCLTVVTFLAFATTAYATGGHRRHYQQTVRSCAFMDDDKDGYCDNWGTNCLFVDTVYSQVLFLALLVIITQVSPLLQPYGKSETCSCCLIFIIFYHPFFLSKMCNKKDRSS